MTKPQDYWQRREAASQQALTRALHENHVKDECLAIAMEALQMNGEKDVRWIAACTLAEIKRRLTELEIEKEVNQRLAQLGTEETDNAGT